MLVDRRIPVEGEPPRSVGKILAVGKNYRDHVAEMGGDPEPVVFLKPPTALRLAGEEVVLPRQRGSVHYELEIVLALSGGGCGLGDAEALETVGAYGLGLDLTLRDLQTQAKAKGQPWALAKGFDGSLPVSPFVPAARIPDPSALAFTLELNGTVRQRGRSADMILPIPRLVAFLSRGMTLEPGDLILTGTPSGVGPVVPGDEARMVLEGFLDTTVRFA
jgi:2-keto-4-pentenoate hydratase/2-oxohepta-3-ene-1,7-dioic acid hydratase in catechol pathway